MYRKRKSDRPALFFLSLFVFIVIAGVHQLRAGSIKITKTSGPENLCSGDTASYTLNQEIENTEDFPNARDESKEGAKTSKNTVTAKIVQGNAVFSGNNKKTKTFSNGLQGSECGDINCADALINTLNFDLKFQGPSVVKVKVDSKLTCVTCDFGTQEFEGTKIINVTAVKPVLKGISAGNTPDISPKIALNAQDKYRKAHWKLKLKPGEVSNFKAKITTPSGNVKFSKSKSGSFKNMITLTDNDPKDFWVKAKKGANPGRYDIKAEVEFKGNGQTCTAKNDSTLFEFRFSSITSACGPTTNKNIPRNLFAESRCIDFRSLPIWLVLFGHLRLFPNVNAVSEDASLTQTYTWKYKLITFPTGKFNGVVEQETKIAAEATGNVFAAGALSFFDVAAEATTTMSNGISVSGLVAGNGSVSVTRSVSAPRFGIVFPDSKTFTGLSTEFRNNNAQYRVGQTVTAKEKLKLEIDREGALAETGQGNAITKKDGFFTEFNGRFEILRR